MPVGVDGDEMSPPIVRQRVSLDPSKIRETCHDCARPPMPGSHRCAACQEAHRLEARASRLRLGRTIESVALYMIRERCALIARDLDALTGTPELDAATTTIRELLHGRHSTR